MATVENTKPVKVTKIEILVRCQALLKQQKFTADQKKDLEVLFTDLRKVYGGK